MILHQWRMEKLCRDLDLDEWGLWRQQQEDRNSPWLPIIKQCYDMLTNMLFNSVKMDTALIVVPLLQNHRGGIKHYVFEESGESEHTNETHAERKVLSNRTFPDDIEKFLGKPADAWLFYITRSPCRECSSAIVQAIRAGRLKNVVVAFESVYKRSRPSEAFLNLVRDQYDRNRPGGVELFRVFRTYEDKLALERALQRRTMSGEGERVIYGLVPGERSHRLKDIDTSSPLGRYSRSTREYNNMLITQHQGIAIITPITQIFITENKDLLHNDDPTLRFRRLVRAPQEQR